MYFYPSQHGSRLPHTHTQNSHHFHSQKIKYAIYPSLDVYKVKTLWQLKESGYTEHILEIAAGEVTPSHDGWDLSNLPRFKKSLIIYTISKMDIYATDDIWEKQTHTHTHTT